MSDADFKIHLRICLTRETLNNEFQAALAGVISESDLDHSLIESEIPKKSEFKGPVKKTKREKIMNFSSTLKKVRIDR